MLIRIGRVRGQSMLPRIPPDAFIITCKLPRYWRKKAGQIFYLDHPRYGRIVKTLSHIDGQSYWFRSEANVGVSAEAIGALTDKHILGRVVWVIRPPQP